MKTLLIKNNNLKMKKIDWFFVGQDIQFQCDSPLEDILEFYDEIGDIVSAQEINPSTDIYLAYDENLYEMTYSDFDQLQTKGVCRAYYIGTIKENLDMDVESDRDFHDWYFN